MEAGESLEQTAAQAGSTIAPSNNFPAAPASELSAFFDVGKAREFAKNAISRGGQQAWMRSKLMAVGQGRAGKTSLVRSLLGEPFDETVMSTIGAHTETLCVVNKTTAAQWKKRDATESSQHREYVMLLHAHIAKRLRCTPTALPSTLPEAVRTELLLMQVAVSEKDMHQLLQRCLEGLSSNRIEAKDLPDGPIVREAALILLPLLGFRWAPSDTTWSFDLDNVRQANAAEWLKWASTQPPTAFESHGGVTSLEGKWREVSGEGVGLELQVKFRSGNLFETNGSPQQHKRMEMEWTDLVFADGLPVEAFRAHWTSNGETGLVAVVLHGPTLVFRIFGSTQPPGPLFKLGREATASSATSSADVNERSVKTLRPVAFDNGAEQPASDIAAGASHVIARSSPAQTIEESPTIISHIEVLDHESDEIDTALISSYLETELLDQIVFSIWDYGGQKVFYTLHHIFLTRCGVYLCVFDMQEFQVEGAKALRLKYLEFWLSSIRIHANGAPVLLVGTHKDIVSDAREIMAIDNEVRRTFIDKGLLTNVVRNKTQGLWFFPINNRDAADVTIQLLREAIDKAVRSDVNSYIWNEIPIQWMKMLDDLLDPSQDHDRELVSVADVEKRGIKHGIPAAEIQTMLKLFHSLGVVLFWSDIPELEKMIVINPQWLIDAITKVVREFATDDDEASNDPAEQRRHLDEEYMDLMQQYHQEFKRLRTSARISGKMLKILWKDWPHHYDFLVYLMKHTGLLCDWKSGRGSSDDGGSVTYLVPSLLHLLPEAPAPERPCVPPLLLASQQLRHEQSANPIAAAGRSSSTSQASFCREGNRGTLHAAVCSRRASWSLWASPLHFCCYEARAHFLAAALPAQ